MTKKFVFSVIALAMAVSPFLSVNADNGNWDAAISAAAWNYGDYRVERLAFASDAIGPINLGGYTVVAEPADSCESDDCPLYDVYLLKDGYKLLVNDVPAEALDLSRFNANDGRFVFVSSIEAGSDTTDDHYTVTEYATDGTATTLVDDVFFSGVEWIDAMVDEDTVYFNTALDFTGKTSVDQAGVYVYDAAEGDADIIGAHWELREEELQDAVDGLVLIKMVFPAGNKQLWIGDTHNVNYMGMTRSAIGGTWTEPEADVYAARFVGSDEVEFFMNFTRYTYEIDTDTLTKHDGEFLNWYRSPEDAYQVNGTYMAWLDPSDTLSVSDGSNVTTLGTATGGNFLLESGRVFYASGSEGKVYDFTTGVTTSLPFAVTDSDGGDIVVGNDSAGNVAYLNMETGETYELGFGGAPVLSDDMHVYWQGTDGSIYEGTVSLPSIDSVGTVSAVKTSGSNTVYLIVDGEKFAVPSEKTYFTWFSSWSSVQTVSSATLASYEDGGMATFAPGTRVKISGDSKVYVVGNDGKLHWVTSETAAYSIFGSTWNKGILTITQQDLVTNPLGASVDSENALQAV